MNLAPKTKKIVAIGSAALVVIAIAFVAVLAILIRNAPEHVPAVTAYANGRSAEVEPYLYCPVDQPLCGNEGESTTLPLGNSPVLQLSLPSEIAKAPWILASVYGDAATGEIVETDKLYLPDSAVSVTVQAKDPDGRELLGVEVRLPSGVIDSDTQQEEIISHAIWSIATMAPAEAE